MRRPELILLAALAVPGAAFAEDLRFVGCPIYRDADAGRKSGCWLAEDPASGQRYDVSLAPAKPDWNYAVLVEGRAAPDAKDACGGIVLDPVRTSILADACPRHMLPAEGFAGRKYVLPPRNVAPAAVPRKVPPGPYATRTFSLVYELNSSFLDYQLDDFLLDEAITWIRAAKPQRVVVTGWAATRPQMVSGREIDEPPQIAQERAEKVTEALVRLGVDRGAIEVRWKGDAQPSAAAEGADGLAEPSRRRVDIEAVVGSQGS